MWGTGTQNGKGTQSDPNYVSRLLARSECLLGAGGGGKNYSYTTVHIIANNSGSDWNDQYDTKRCDKVF